MNRRLFFLIAGLISVLVIAGCSAKNEENDPSYIKGEKALADRRFEDAKNAFTDCLKKFPSSWRVHRKLGDIYYDELERPEYAIYHFEQSIILNPQREETPKLQNWCEEARQRLYQQLKREYSQSEVGVKQQMEIEMIRLRNLVAELRAGNPAAAEKLSPIDIENRRRAEERLQNRIRMNSESRQPPPTVAVDDNPPQTQPIVAPPPVVTTPPSPPPVAPPPVTQSVTPPTVAENVPAANEPTPEERRAALASRLAPGDKVHRVKSGETLSSIANRYYGDSTKYKFILNANPKLRGKTLREGMVLKIPAVPQRQGR